MPNRTAKNEAATVDPDLVRLSDSMRPLIKGAIAWAKG